VWRNITKIRPCVTFRWFNRSDRFLFLSSSTTFLNEEEEEEEKQYKCDGGGKIMQ